MQTTLESPDLESSLGIDSRGNLPIPGRECDCGSWLWSHLSFPKPNTITAYCAKCGKGPINHHRLADDKSDPWPKPVFAPLAAIKAKPTPWWHTPLYLLTAILALLILAIASPFLAIALFVFLGIGAITTGAIVALCWACTKLFCG